MALSNYDVDFKTALAGATINIHAGTHTSTLSLKGTINVTGPTGGITIEGGTAPGSKTSTNVEVFNVAATATVSLAGLTITNGYSAGDGGGIYNGGTLYLTDDVFSFDHAAGDGGGLYNAASGSVESSGTPALSSLSFSNDNAGSNGGGIYSSAR